MSKTSIRRVRGIAIFIVFLALAATILQLEKRSGRSSSFNFKDSQNEYRDLKFINKARIQFIALNVSDAQTGIDKIIAERSKQRIRKQSESSYGAYLFTVDQDEVPTIVEELKNYGSVVSQVEQVDTSLVNLDYEGEAARLASYEKEQADLDLVRFPSEAQNRRKEVLHSLIQQSRSNLEKLQESESVLLYITLSPQSSGYGAVGTIQNAVIRYFVWLGIFTVAAILIYFGTRLIMYILALMGIKGFGSDAAGGSYTYGGSYSNYSRHSGYGYGNKRKVKRIYKDKSSSSDEDKENK